jgi:hypothetical protein
MIISQEKWMNLRAFKVADGDLLAGLVLHQGPRLGQLHDLVPPPVARIVRGPPREADAAPVSRAAGGSI